MQALTAAWRCSQACPPDRGVVQHKTKPFRNYAKPLKQAFYATPDPVRAVREELHNLRQRDPQQPQQALDLTEDVIGLAQEGLVDRRHLGVGVALVVEDLDGEQARLPPGGLKAAVSVLASPPLPLVLAGPHPTAIEAQPDALARQQPAAEQGPIENTLDGRRTLSERGDARADSEVNDH
ncbi:MAG TPA: hypothetical protein QGF58_29820 [Myxococcota bacterium]|nr:hypothetical protein [Myxococcota bacterium]